MARSINKNIAICLVTLCAGLVVGRTFLAVSVRARSQRLLACSDDPVAIGDIGIENAGAVLQIPSVGYIASRAIGIAGGTRCGHAARTD